MSRSAPHIYLSALPLSPQESEISKLYRHRFANTLKVENGGLQSWPTEEIVVQHGASDCSCLTFSPDGALLAVGLADGKIRIWDAETGEEFCCLDGHSKAVTALAFSKGGRYIVSGSTDKTLRRWEKSTGRPLAVMSGHEGGVLAVGFDPDNKFIVSGSADQTVRLWKMEGELIGVPLRPDQGKIHSVSVSSDGSRLIAGASTGGPCFWIVKNVGSPIRISETRNNDMGLTPSSLFKLSAVTRDTTRLVALLDDGRHILPWDTTSGKLVGSRPVAVADRERQPTAFAISPDGRRMAMAGIGEDAIRITNVETGESLGEPLLGHTGTVNCLAFSADGKRLASGSTDGSIRLWNVGRGSGYEDPLRRARHAVSAGRRKLVKSTELISHAAIRTSLAVVATQPRLIQGTSISIDAHSSRGRQNLYVSRSGSTRLYEKKDRSNGLTSNAERKVYENCQMDKDGWLVTEEGGLICWIPNSLRVSDHHFRANDGTEDTHLDTRNFVFGAQWHQCLTSRV
jgi:WD40 repeat protein